LAQALHDDTFVWSSSDATDQLIFTSTTNKEFSVYADNGIRFVTGTNGAVEMNAISLNGSTISDWNQIVTFQGSNVISVAAVGTPLQNGAELLSAYQTAKQLTLSSNNRAVLYLSPGTYDLGQNYLTLDSEFIDIKGAVPVQLTQQTYPKRTINGKEYTYSKTIDTGRNLTSIISGGGVIQSANDVAISDIQLDCPYQPASDLNLTFVNGVRFSSMAAGVNYAGIYIDCVAENNAFGYQGDASGTFIRCVAKDSSFAWKGNASGSFEDCTAQLDSFGFSYHEASGTFIRCVSGNGGFGYTGKASGYFKDCSAGAFAFGRLSAESSGVFIGCLASGWSFDDNLSGGLFVNCVSGNNSFGCYDKSSISSATFINCTAGTYSFGTFNAAKENFNYNASGHTFEGGPIVGDGSGLRNINVATAISDGSITAAKVSGDVITASSLTDGSISNLNITGNLTVNGSPVNGLPVSLDMNGNKIINLGTASDDTDAASQGHVKTMMQQVPGYGDIPMGEFTSQVSMPDRPTGPGLIVNAGEIADNAVKTEAIDDGAITTAKLASESVTADKIATNSISSAMLMPNISIVPSGAIMAWPVEILPDGWVACDGAEYTNTVAEYTPLFTVIGYQYGGSDNTFNVPDYRGYFMRGWEGSYENRDPDADARIARADGTAGDEIGTTQADEFEEHNHNAGGYNQLLHINGYNTFTGGDNSTTEPALNITGTMENAGNSTETRPKNISVKWIIKL
jgi:hypothetical protein